MSATQIDRYELLGHLGTGGFGSVYRARHVHTGQIVALKVTETTEPVAIERLLRESRIIAAIGHPNIVKIFDAGVEPGRAFVAMELVEGATLNDLLHRDRVFAPARALAIAQQLLAALHAAHEQGVIHRDVKPSNVLLTAAPGGGERVKLVDFGISKQLDSAPSDGHTRPGTSMGTPGFMAPEQYGESHGADARTDVYAVAATLYLMLAGRLPFQAQAYEDWVVKVRTEPPLPLAHAAPHLPSALAAIVDRGLNLRREDRWQSAGAFSQALGSVVFASNVPLAVAPTLVAQVNPLEHQTTHSPHALASQLRTAPAPTPSRAPVIFFGLGLLTVLLSMGGAAVWFWPRLGIGAPIAASSASAPVTSATTSPLPSATAPVADTAAVADSATPANARKAPPVVASAGTAVKTPPVVASAGTAAKTPPPVVASAGSATSATSATSASSAPAGGSPSSNPALASHTRVVTMHTDIAGTNAFAAVKKIIADAKPAMGPCNKSGKEDFACVTFDLVSTGPRQRFGASRPCTPENDPALVQCVSKAISKAGAAGWEGSGAGGVAKVTVGW